MKQSIKSKTSYIITVFLFLSSIAFCQERNIDSLKLILQNKSSHDTIIIQTLIKLSDEYSSKKPDTSIIILNTALQKATTIGNKDLIGATYNYFGILFWETFEKYDTAIVFYNKSLKCYEQKNDKYKIGMILNNIGLVYFDKGDYVKSAEYSIKSINIMEELVRLFPDNKKNQNSLANKYSSLANLLNVQGEYIEAEKYLLKAYTIFKKTDNKNGITKILGNWGINLRQQNKYNEALSKLNEGLVIAKELNNYYFEANILSNIGTIYGNLNEYDKSIEFAKKSLEVNYKINSSTGIATSLGNIANQYYLKKDYTKSIDFAKKALSASINIGKSDLTKTIYQILGESYFATKNFKESSFYLKQYSNIKDSLYNEETSKSISSLKIKYETEIKDNQISLLNKDQTIKNTEIKKQKAEADRQAIIRNAFIFGFILVLALAFFILRGYNQKQKANAIITMQKLEVEEQKYLIEEKHKEITDSINYAERIQRSFLASKDILDANLKDYFVLFKPKDVVSGDFYWASKLENNHFALVTADSTGHGVPGAIMSLLNITSLEKAIEHYSNPADIFNHTRKTIINRLKKDGSAEGGKDGMDASIICFDFKNNKIIIASANNPIWIVRGTEVLEIKPDKMPIGKHDNQDISFKQQEINIQKGDIIYTLTDGYPDQFGGEKGKKFMSKNLRELLLNNSSLSMNEQKILLESTFKNWVGDLEQVDDVTVIGVRV
jgi:serine phosphatase RsbU (regulator of sigma subunit)